MRMSLEEQLKNLRVSISRIKGGISFGDDIPSTEDKIESIVDALHDVEEIFTYIHDRLKMLVE